VAESVYTKFSPFKYLGGFIIGRSFVAIQPANHFELLTLPQAVVIIEDGARLPWLDWLLHYGDQIIIADFGVKYQSGRGRSGGATMEKGGTPFRVNPQYSGVSGNNFIVRALNRRRREIEREIWRSILN
jgi:hypothetical protein